MKPQLAVSSPALWSVVLRDRVATRILYRDGIRRIRLQMLAASERQGKAHLLADIFHSRALERLAAAAHCHAELLVFQLVHLFREDEIDPHALSAGGEPELVDASEIGAAILLIADADGCIADGSSW